MVTANNKVTGATKEFSPFEWQMMQDWPESEWVKVKPDAPNEAKAAAKGAKAKAEEDAKAKAKAEEDAKIKAALDALPPVDGIVIDDQNPPII